MGGGKLKLIAFLGIFAALLGANDAANVLGLFTSSSPSHLIVHMTYASALAARGHNVTVVTTRSMKEEYPNMHHVFIPPTATRLKEMTEMLAEMTKPQSPSKAFSTTLRSMTVFGNVQYEAIKDQRFQDFMHNPGNRFDLMILGYFFSDYQFGVGAHFDCPIAISWMDASNFFVDRYVGNPAEISYVPISPMIAVPDTTNFTGRLQNFFIGLTSSVFRAFMDRQMRKSYKELFPAPQYPSFDVASKKVSLLLSNYHFTEGIVRPKVPAAIDVGGIQVKEQPDPLPKHLQEIVDASSEHGVVYLSFGSNVGSKDFSHEFFQKIYKALASLKQTVLWKWDGEQKPGNAPNIHYEKWLPQDDLLAHPNLKLFITHAGKGSVAEAQYHGVPMVMLPIFADQPKNAKDVATSGFGVVLDHATITTETLKDAVLEVLKNPKYTENVKRFSILYRDRPATARETAVFWLEYVIRHKGAYHMQSPLVHLNSFQYVSADVIFVLLLVSFVAYQLIKVPVLFAWSKICRRRSNGQKLKGQ